MKLLLTDFSFQIRLCLSASIDLTESDLHPYVCVVKLTANCDWYSTYQYAMLSCLETTDIFQMEHFYRA